MKILNRNSTLIFVLLHLIIQGVLGNHPSACENAKQCDDCIRIGCTWCKEMNEPGLQVQRCRSNAGNCPKDQILKPESTIVITRDGSLSKSMRIKPQGAEATLAVGERKSIELVYNDGEDKPLDLYYIMDLSYTMRDDKVEDDNQY